MIKQTDVIYKIHVASAALFILVYKVFFQSISLESLQHTLYKKNNKYFWRDQIGTTFALSSLINFSLTDIVKSINSYMRQRQMWVSNPYRPRIRVRYASLFSRYELYFLN